MASGMESRKNMHQQSRSQGKTGSEHGEGDEDERNGGING